jgi:hypothetical protein
LRSHPDDWERWCSTDQRAAQGKEAHGFSQQHALLLVHRMAAFIAMAKEDTKIRRVGE